MRKISGNRIRLLQGGKGMTVVCPKCGHPVTPTADINIELLREGELDPFFCPDCHTFLGVGYIDGGEFGFLTIHDLKKITAQS
jgi:hypothetical protein